MPTPRDGVGVTAATTVRFTAARVLELGDGEPDGEGDGMPLPDADALGVGSTVGPTDGAGRPTDGDVPTRTTRGVGAPCTPTAPDDGELADGDGVTDGPGVTGAVVTTGGEPAATAGNWGSAHAYTPAPIPATPTAYRDRLNACRRTAAISDAG